MKTPGMTVKYILLSERSQSERATYCMIPTIWHSEKGKTTETVKRTVAATTGWGDQIRMDKTGTDGAQESETVQYETVMVETCYMFIKIHTMYNTTSNVNNGLQLVVIYQHWLNCNKSATLFKTKQQTQDEIIYAKPHHRASLIDQLVKNPPTMQETSVQFLAWEDPLEKG